MSLSLEKSVTHFMVSIIFSAYLVQAVSYATLHNDALLDIYSPVSAVYIMRKKLRVFEWNTWLINNHSFVLVGYEMVDSQRGAL